MSDNAHGIALAKLAERSMGALKSAQTVGARKTTSQNRAHGR